jgi:membrane-bound lytic murein transglycosylase B
MSSRPSVRTIVEGNVFLLTLLRHVIIAGLVTIAATILLQSASWVMAQPTSAQGGTQPPEGSPATSAERLDFPVFVERLRVEAAERGISEDTIKLALTTLEPSASVIERDQTQAELVLSIDDYLARRLTRPVIRAARANATKHKALLARVHDKYGVSPRFIVAIWGLESNFGRFSGVRPTIQALATLAWEGRRGPFFRAELMDALTIVDRKHIALEQLKGSWAGAMGQTQFMPSSYLKWAEDFDEDGDRDIWRSTPDVFASIANYLKSHGWSSQRTWGREVTLPDSDIAVIREKAGMRVEGCRAEREMTKPLPLQAWRDLGVKTADGKALPRVDIEASLISTGKRTFLVYGNYDALLEYNCAHSYALAVALLSERIG